MSKKNSTAVTLTTLFVCTVIFIGTVVILLLNYQPWVAAANFIAQDINVLPFSNSLLALWGFGDAINFFFRNMMAGIALLGAIGVCIYLVSNDKKTKSKITPFHIFVVVAIALFIAGPGDVINWFWLNLISITAVFLMVLCQMLQLLAWCTSTPATRAGIAQIFGGNDLGMSNPAVQTKYKVLAAAAYCLELFVCLLEYPPYDGGLTGIIADFPLLDPYLIQYGQIVTFVITMFGFELMVGLLVGFLGSLFNSKTTQYE